MGRWAYRWVSVWLNPDKIPPEEKLTCNSCGSKDMLFILQLYAPIDDEVHTPNAFHRTLYVFCCQNEKCIQKGGNNGVRVFRSQLPRKNSFYPFDELNDGEVIFDKTREVKQQLAKGSKPFQFTPHLIVSESEIDCLEDANAVINSKFKSVIEDQVKQREEGGGYEDDTPITQSDIDGVMDAISQSSVGSGNKAVKSNGKGSKGVIMGENLDKSMTYFHHRIDIARDQVFKEGGKWARNYFLVTLIVPM